VDDALVLSAQLALLLVVETKEKSIPEKELLTVG